MRNSPIVPDWKFEDVTEANAAETIAFSNWSRGQLIGRLITMESALIAVGVNLRRFGGMDDLCSRSKQMFIGAFSEAFGFRLPLVGDWAEHADSFWRMYQEVLDLEAGMDCEESVEKPVEEMPEPPAMPEPLPMPELTMPSLAPVYQTFDPVPAQDSVITFFVKEEVIKIASGGDVYWRGKLVESDDAFKDAMLDLASSLRELTGHNRSA